MMALMRNPILACLAVVAAWCGEPGAQFPEAKPVPRLQAVPLPYDRLSFTRDGAEIARYHFGPNLRRPFVFPLAGPSGRPLTRMGHPHDPQGHSHHNSVWISHHDVDGISYWNDGGQGRIVHERMLRIEDGGDSAWALTEGAWVAGGKKLLNERRRVEVRLLPDGEWLLLLDLELRPQAGRAVLGKTPFGPIGVRMAKTVGVNDGGGRILNSEGGLNEPQVLWKRARWVDYSGPAAPDRVEGIALLDHPANPNHPAFFHVRDDGWMGASLTFDAPRTIEAKAPLRLRYGLWIHRGAPPAAAIEARWKDFAAAPLPGMSGPGEK
jgi:hypothetical protein